MPQNYFLDPMGLASRAASTKPREELIAEIAYFRAKERGFRPGHELEDWLAAEALVQKLNHWNPP